MRLDLYITSKTTIHKRGTGVYDRENGQTVELKTMEEVRSDVQKLKSAGFDKKTSFRKIK